MKNEIICPICNTENPAYSLTCGNCKSYLRERVVNIDLWKTLATLTVSPSEGFISIRNSEHKNFIALIFFAAILKILHDTMFLSLFYYSEPEITKNLLTNLAIVGGIFLALTVVFSLSLKAIALIGRVKLRFKDNLAIFLYSFFPYIIGVIILLPLEYIIFGEYLVSRNPTWFRLSSSFAYMFTALEGAILLWNIFLLIVGIKTQTNSKLFSVCFGLVFIFITYFAYFITSKYLFM
jgi:glucose-6-phosphate-specific signal transduction histidine kinase